MTTLRKALKRLLTLSGVPTVVTLFPDGRVCARTLRRRKSHLTVQLTAFPLKKHLAARALPQVEMPLDVPRGTLENNSAPEPLPRTWFSETPALPNEAGSPRETPPNSIHPDIPPNVEEYIP